MKTAMAMLFAVLLVACCANAQSSKFSLAFTSASAGSPCQTEPLDPDALCPNQEWIITDASGTVTDYNGSEGSQAHDEFGALKVRGTAVVTAHFTSAAGAAQSGAGADASFADTLTFAGLNGKNSGLNFTLQIVDAKGRKVNKAQIIAASGTDYPTH